MLQGKKQHESNKEMNDNMTPSAVELPRTQDEDPMKFCHWVLMKTNQPAKTLSKIQAKAKNRSCEVKVQDQD